MADDIPPDVRAYLDEVALHLRGRSPSVAWARYLAWTRYLLRACHRTPRRPPLPRGRPSHINREEIIIRLLRADLSGERGALARPSRRCKTLTA
jgi:hypothetical protein